jgi:hypothetical protein
MGRIHENARAIPLDDPGTVDYYRYFSALHTLPTHTWKWVTRLAGLV